MRPDYGYLVRTSFHELIAAHALTIQGRLRAFVDAQAETPYSTLTLPYYSQKQAETFPSVRGWVYLRDTPTNRKRLEDRAQIDFFSLMGDPAAPDLRVLELIEGHMRDLLDIKTSRNAFYAYFDVKDYAANPDHPPTIGRCRLETGGWRDIPDSDPLVAHWLADCKLFHL